MAVCFYTFVVIFSRRKVTREADAVPPRQKSSRLGSRGCQERLRAPRIDIALGTDPTTSAARKVERLRTAGATAAKIARIQGCQLPMLPLLSPSFAAVVFRASAQGVPGDRPAV